MTGRKPVAEEVTWSIFYYFPHLTFYLNPFLLKATRKGEDLWGAEKFLLGQSCYGSPVSVQAGLGRGSKLNLSLVHTYACSLENNLARNLLKEFPWWGQKHPYSCWSLTLSSAQRNSLLLFMRSVSPDRNWDVTSKELSLTCGTYCVLEKHIFLTLENSGSPVSSQSIHLFSTHCQSS